MYATCLKYGSFFLYTSTIFLSVHICVYLPPPSQQPYLSCQLSGWLLLHFYNKPQNLWGTFSMVSKSYILSCRSSQFSHSVKPIYVFYKFRFLKPVRCKGKLMLGNSNTHSVYFNPFSTNLPLLYPLKTLESIRFSDVIREYRSATLFENG